MPLFWKTEPKLTNSERISTFSYLSGSKGLGFLCASFTSLSVAGASSYCIGASMKVSQCKGDSGCPTTETWSSGAKVEDRFPGKQSEGVPETSPPSPQQLTPTQLS